MHAELNSMHPNKGMQGIERLSSYDSADHVMTTSDMESMQHLGLTGQCWVICEDINKYQFSDELYYIHFSS